MQTCDQCRHWKAPEGQKNIGDKPAGTCHRYPAKVFLLNTQTVAGPTIAVQAFYPPTAGNDFCGEFVPLAANS